MKDLDPNWYQVYGLGEVGSLEGIVFNNFNIEDFDYTDKKIHGMDFGYTNDPTSLVSVVVKDKTLYVDELFYRQGLTNQDISTLMEQSGLRKHYDIIYCDSAEPKSIEELHRMGWIAKPASKGPDSILKGIDNLKSYNIVISRRSLNLIKELRNYQWQKDKDGKYVNRPIGIDHAIDALRYVVGTHFAIKNKVSFKVL
jgi:phage terminase large subunit